MLVLGNPPFNYQLLVLNLVCMNVWVRVGFLGDCVYCDKHGADRILVLVVYHV